MHSARALQVGKLNTFAVAAFGIDDQRWFGERCARKQYQQPRVQPIREGLLCDGLGNGRATTKALLLAMVGIPISRGWSACPSKSSNNVS
jgi:hypothetical protein